MSYATEGFDREGRRMVYGRGGWKLAPNPFYRIHVEHDPAQQQVVRLCDYHLRQAEDCLMVDERDVPEAQSECFCTTCHFCDS